MSKTLYSLGVILTLLSFSYNAAAHSGIEHSPNMHSLMHIVISVSAGFAFIAAAYFLLSKRLPKAIKQPIKPANKIVKK